MERQREKSEITEEKEAKEIATLRKELARLRELKRQNEQLKVKAVEKASEVFEQESVEPETEESAEVTDVDQKLDQIEDFLSSKLGSIDEETYSQYATQVEGELQKIEQEITKEKLFVEEEISAYDNLLKLYPWLEEKRYFFMYSIPNQKSNESDYESWKTEWTKVLFDYARFAILHVLYLRQLSAIKPFSNFEQRELALRQLAEELIDQKLAEYISKKKGIVRVYWKTLEAWAEEIYNWGMENSPLEPILMHEIREAEKEFSTLPEEDIEEIFKMLSKEKKGEIIKLKGGKLAFKLAIK